MSTTRSFAAVDLGAESGRVVLGRLGGGRVELEVVHRFANRPVWLPDGLHWDLQGLFAETLRGLARAARDGALDGIGVDAWGCDYALLDGDGRMLGLPFSYRDEQRASPATVSRVHARVGREELYRRTGIQTMPINTVFQLSTEAGGTAASAAERIALIPDLFALWMTGNLVNELTVASTTGLLEARVDAWATDLAARLGLPSRPFAGAVAQPGVEIGRLLKPHRELAAQAVGTVVRTVAGHDTAAAFVAAPLAGEHGAVLSSGTWSLLGLELSEPLLGPEAAAFNLTNERGVAGTVRLLRNVMGLWLLQECRRAWHAHGTERSYDELEALAGEARRDVAVFDPDDDSLLHAGGAMPSRIAALCKAGEQTPPRDDGELVRSILVSLACKYRLVLERLERVSGRRIETIHVVGGGARNQLLCRLTADILQREVVAGPVEATALGNILVQGIAAGELRDLEEARDVVRRSAELHRCEPGPVAGMEEIFQRFLTVTGEAVPAPA